MIFGILALKGFSLKLQKKLSFWLLAFLSISLFVSPSFAQPNGEIININLADQIVFINLTNEDLKLGDIVDIYKNEDIFLTLEVIGTSDVVSKLASLPQTPPSVLKEKFQQIKVGDVALKATRKTRSAGEVLFTYTENPGKFLLDDFEEDQSQRISSQETKQESDEDQDEATKELVLRSVELSKELERIQQDRDRLAQNLSASQEKFQSALAEAEAIQNENARLKDEVGRLSSLAQRNLSEKEKYQQKALLFETQIEALQKKLDEVIQLTEQNLINYETP